MRTPALPVLLAVALMLTGCSTKMAVIGNLASMCVVVALFYSTINLKRP